MKIRPTAQATAMPVTVVPGLRIPSPVTVTALDVNGYDVEVEVVPRNGRLIAQEVRVRQRDGGPPVTGEAIRGVPVAMLTKHAGTLLLSDDGVAEDGSTKLSRRVLTPETIAGFRAEGPTNKALWWVGYLYKVALALGEPPTKAVETALELPRATAGRWVALARRKGYLGPAESSRAGG